MDCKTAHLLLDFARPRSTELEASEAEALQNHLIDCPACAGIARDERRLDAHIGRAVRDVPIPGGLRERLLKGVEAESHDDWTRRLVRAGWSLAAAAALLAVVWIGAEWNARPRTINETQLQQDFWNRTANPERDPVDNWLRAQKIRVPAPDDFKYGLLTDYHMTELQGHRVPVLVFTRANDKAQVCHARVYLLDASQFKIDDLRPIPESRATVDIVRPDGAPFAYLVVHNADSLDLFRETEQLGSSQD